MHRGYKTDATARVLAQTPHALAGRSQWSRKTPIRAAAASAIRNVVQCTQTGGGLWKLSRRLLHHLMVSFSAVSEACTCSRHVSRDRGIAGEHRLRALCSLVPSFARAAHPRIRHKRSSCAEPAVAPAVRVRPSAAPGQPTRRITRTLRQFSSGTLRVPNALCQRDRMVTDRSRRTARGSLGAPPVTRRRGERHWT